MKAHTHKVAFDDEHDAAFCMTCGEWLEPTCSDPNCWACKDRPERHHES